jgi:hypothetical protein
MLVKKLRRCARSKCTIKSWSWQIKAHDYGNSGCREIEKKVQIAQPHHGGVIRSDQCMGGNKRDESEAEAKTRDNVMRGGVNK